MDKLLLANRKGLYPVREAVYAMANVYNNRTLNISIQVNPDPLHAGLPYFKVYDSFSYAKAQRVARISMEVPAYIYHTNVDGKSDWVLNAKERKLLDKILASKSTEHPGLTVWQDVIVSYNREKFNLDFATVILCTRESKSAFVKDYSDIPNIDLIIPIDTPRIKYANGIK